MKPKRNLPISLTLAISLGLIALFCAWSRMFSLGLNDQIPGTIAFEFYNDSQQRFEANIASFGVVERTSSGTFRPLWEIRGRQRIWSIKYGAKYPGLREITPAKQLRTGIIYKAFASDLPAIGPGGNAEMYFRLDKRIFQGQESFIYR